MAEWTERAGRPPEQDGAGRPDQDAPTAEQLMVRVARGDETAFGQLFDLLSGPVLSLVRTVLRDPAQSEEVAQEVLVELWRTAPRYDPALGSATTWALTMAHRRAVDRVRSEQSATDRESRVGRLDERRPFDEVAETVAIRLEQAQVRRCVSTLTSLQRESVLLAFYRGHTYRQVAELLGAPLGTVKTRMRDALIRLRDCLGVG
ncbi:RNA polymerase subunit sigma [Actinoalloteichus sp. AHMU CJ021]|nr:RNA polymerase subunit sigma [Actinoalloteichus sp. AHMU CJ021]